MMFNVRSVGRNKHIYIVFASKRQLFKCGVHKALWEHKPEANILPRGHSATCTEKVTFEVCVKNKWKFIKQKREQRTFQIEGAPCTKSMLSRKHD